jgi:quercetin dioxygenase-like cupin family protein
MARRLVAVFALVLGLVPLQAQAPALPPGITTTPVFDNATVGVIRLGLAAGAREQPHTHPYGMLVVFLNASDVEIHNGATVTKGPRKTGEVVYFAPNTTHYAINAGTMAAEGLVLSIKPDRVRGGPGTPAQALPGVTRTPVLDNAEVTITKLDFEPDVRESVHTHPYDLIVVPATPARADIQVGSKKQVRSFAVGEAIFIPRMTPHALANAGTSSFRLLGIAIK